MESGTGIEFNITPLSAELMSANIKDKFMGTHLIDIDDIVFRESDIRRRRDLESKRANIFSNGFTQPLTINILENVHRVVNGKTRLLIVNENKDLFIKRHGRMIRCELYNGLTVEEEDYLDASINASQSEISAEERYDFVEKYIELYDYVELANILNCSVGRIEMLDFFVKSSEEELVKNPDGTVNLRQSERMKTLKAEDPENRKKVADFKAPLNDFGRKKRAILIENINRRIKNKDILGETEDDIVTHEVEKAERGGIESYQATTIIPKGSDGKVGAFGGVLLSEKPDKVIMLNFENNDFMMFNSTKEKVQSQGLMTYLYAKENGKEHVLVNRSDFECNKWKAKYPDANIVNTTVERYLLNHLEESDEKVLIYFHLSGNLDARNILSEHTLEDIFTMIPNAVILSIYPTKWYDEVTMDVELLTRFGIKASQKGVHSLNDYLELIMEQQKNVNLLYEIMWGKDSYRGVALVKWTRSI